MFTNLYRKVLRVLPVMLLAVCIFVPEIVSAHQPRIVSDRQTIVSNPEISQAFYGKLVGVPDVYVIHAAIPFDLYAGVLVPDIEGQKKDVSAVILKDGVQVAVLNGTAFDWNQFFEEFGMVHPSCVGLCMQTFPIFCGVPLPPVCN